MTDYFAGLVMGIVLIALYHIARYLVAALNDRKFERPMVRAPNGRLLEVYVNKRLLRMQRVTRRSR